jgi:hypothetical protein
MYAITRSSHYNAPDRPALSQLKLRNKIAKNAPKHTTSATLSSGLNPDNKLHDTTETKSPTLTPTLANTGPSVTHVIWIFVVVSGMGYLGYRRRLLSARRHAA